MAAYNKIQDFVEHLAEGVHNLSANQLMVALSNTAPGAESPDPSLEGNGILANVTEVAYDYCSTRNITTSSSSQSTGGTYDLVLTDLTLTASGGDVGPFQYIYVYNSAGTGVTNPLICYFNYGSALTLSTGESLTIDFESDGPSTGSLLTLV